jgi:Fur family ferric uptake transcriptional regulator
VRSAPGPVRYDPNVGSAHHHLVCVGCGSLFDVRPSGLDHLRLRPAERHGFDVDGVEVTFRGRCPACQRSA